MIEKKNAKGVMSLLMLVCLSTSLVAQENEKSVSYSVDTPKEITIGQNIDIKVTFNMSEDWYIYAPTSSNAAKGLILSGIKFIAPKGMKADKVQTPIPSNSSLADVFKGKGVIMTQSLIPTEGLVLGIQKIKGTVSYQACNSDYCEPPQSFPIMLKVKVVEK